MRIVAEIGKPIPRVAKGLGINGTTLATWVSRARAAGRAGPAGEEDELARPRRESARLERDNKDWSWSVMSSNVAWSCG